jgi:hypothetical protein
MLHNLRSGSIVATSVDRTDDDAPRAVSVEALNHISFPGFPAHHLELSVGTLVVLLRNLAIDQGLVMEQGY